MEEGVEDKKANVVHKIASQNCIEVEQQKRRSALHMNNKYVKINAFKDKFSLQVLVCECQSVFVCVSAFDVASIFCCCAMGYNGSRTTNYLLLKIYYRLTPFAHINLLI